MNRTKLWLLIAVSGGLLWCARASAQRPPVGTVISADSTAWTVQGTWDAEPGATGYLVDWRSPVNPPHGIGQLFASPAVTDTFAVQSIPRLRDSLMVRLEVFAQPGSTFLGNWIDTLVFVPSSPPPPSAPVATRLTGDEAIGRSIRAAQAWLGWTRAELTDSANAWADLKGYPHISESRVNAIINATGQSGRFAELQILSNSLALSISRQMPENWTAYIGMYLSTFIGSAGLK